MDAETHSIARTVSGVDKESVQNSIQSFLLLMKSQSPEMHSHLGRVFLLCEEWVRWLEQEKITHDSRIFGVGLNQQDTLLAALLHDIGKVGVLPEILNKPEPLSSTERTHMELHSEIGYEMVRSVEGLFNVAQILRHHHERWDGRGYPQGLKETQIPVESRIIALVDAFDAMTSNRSYRKAMDASRAIKEISDNAGSQFCPLLAPLFVEFARFKYTIQECPGLTI